MLVKTKVGMPVRLGKAVGRIIKLNGSTALVNDKTTNSIVEFSTPHGSILKSGIYHLSHLSLKDRRILRDYEVLAKEDNINLYDGLLIK